MDKMELFAFGARAEICLFDSWRKSGNERKNSGRPVPAFCFLPHNRTFRPR
jgi:hypothetical protein